MAFYLLIMYYFMKQLIDRWDHEFDMDWKEKI